MSVFGANPVATAGSRPLVRGEAGPWRVALVGNPNTGKSALFNRLTGSRQRVGNFPGVTVEKRSGVLRLADGSVELLDLPGLYSLEALSPDECLVRDVLQGVAAGVPRPEVVVCVLDAGNLLRNLYLVTELARLGLPLVIALNMIDEARKSGIILDHRLISDRLGVPVVPTSALRGEGVAELRHTLAAVLAVPASERRPPAWPSFLDAAARYAWIRQVLTGAQRREPTPVSRRESIDLLLTHRVFGMGVFLAVMYLVFTAIYTLAAPLMAMIDTAFTWLGDGAGSLLADAPVLQSLVTDGLIAGVGGVVIFLPQILILFFCIALLEDTGYMARAAFLMDRLFGWCGLSGKSFVPLLSAYACAIPGVMAARTLEDCRARRITMFVAPLMSCSARLPVYVLLIGAFIEPRFGPWWAGLVLFAMHLLGLVLALPIAWVLHRGFFRGAAPPFVLELPPFRVPAMRDVFWRLFERGREFVLRAGTVILAMSVVIWALCYFPRPEGVRSMVSDAMLRDIEETRGLGLQAAEALLAEDPTLASELTHRLDGALLEQSWMGRLGRVVQPVFAPAGFDWKITVGVLASFPAREVIVSTLGILYGIGGDVDEADAGLQQQLHAARWPGGEPVFTLPVVAAVMVFFALCLQCGAAVAVMGREAGWRWAIGAFVFMTTLAWSGAVLTYQLGSLLG